MGIPILTLESLDRLLQPQYDDISEQDHQDLNLDDFLKNITLPTPDGIYFQHFSDQHREVKKYILKK